MNDNKQAPISAGMKTAISDSHRGRPFATAYVDIIVANILTIPEGMLRRADYEGQYQYGTAHSLIFIDILA